MTDMTPAHSRAGARNGFGVAALVMGAVALTMVASFILLPLGGPLAVAAVIVGYLAMRRAEQGAASNRGQAIAGLVCGGLALLLAIWTTANIGTWAFRHQGDLLRLSTCTSTAGSDAAQIDCLTELTERLQREAGGA